MAPPPPPPNTETAQQAPAATDAEQEPEPEAQGEEGEGAGAPPPPDALISRADGLRYWEGTAADETGMLGGLPGLPGFAHISRVDLQGSRNFLAKLGIGSRRGLRVVELAVDGGAGIGRITRGLLLDVARQVDVVEPVARFTAALRGVPGVRDVCNVGLQEWRPPSRGARYDLVWTQWCVGHVTDAQLVGYLRRCAGALRAGSGVIVVKENLSTSGRDVFDGVDSSVTREDRKFQALFREAGLRVIRTELQHGLSRGNGRKLLPVRMYALRPFVQKGAAEAEAASSADQ